MLRTLNWQLPVSYRHQDIREKLSCDWQIYIRCSNCDWEQRWDPAFGAPNSLSDTRCHKCSHSGFLLIRHLLSLECMCRECEHWFETVAVGLEDVKCPRCGSGYLTLYGFRVFPEFPKQFGEVLQDHTWGVSAPKDGELLISEIKGFNLLPDRALHFLPLIRFCDRLIWKSDYHGDHGVELIWNLCGNFLRDYFRESGESEACLQAIQAFERSAEATTEPLQRALVEHNIAMACYSFLARDVQVRATALGGADNLRQVGLDNARRALAVFSSLTEPQMRMQAGRIHHIIGDLLKVDDDASDRDLEDALEHYDAALRVPSMPERLRMAIYEARANVVLHSGNMSESQQAEAIRQIELAVAHDDSDRAFSEKWPMLAQLGEVYWARNERGKALKKLEHAAALALSELEAAPDETIIQQRSSQYARVVNSLFRAYVAVGKPLEALAALDMSQAAGLRFGMLQNDSENEERKKKRAERQLENMIGTLFGGRPAHVDRKKVELDTAPTKQAICRLANISNHSNLAVLVLSIHHGTCSAILIFPDRSDIVPLQWNFDRRTHDLLFAVHIALKHGPFREKRLQRVCRELGSALLRGVLPELRSRHARCLAICAPGLISHWPFEAFRESPDSPVCVGAEFPVLYIPSLSISAALAERATATLPRRLLVIPYTGDDLKEAAVEVETLRSLPGGCVTVFDGGRYPKLKLLEELAGDYGFIHFACHGDFDIVNPLRSGLYLNASQSGDSNALRAEDLAKIRFRHAPVVTMSACEAALTSFDASNSFTGLPGSLLRAGARGIVGGRWTVYDATARDFMLRLYASFWQGQCSPSECVLQVQSEFRSERGIEEWASFSYLGVN